MDGSASRPWSAPEASPPDARPSVLPPSPAVSRPGGAARPRPELDPCPDRPVPVLRPRSIPEILDGAFEVFHRRPRTLALVSSAFVVPTSLLAASIAGDVTSDALTNPFAGDTSSWFAAYTPSVIVLSIVQSATLPFIGAAVAHVVAAWYGGRDPGPVEALRFALSKWWRLLVAWFVIHLVSLSIVPAFVGFTFYLGVWLLPLWVMTAPAIAVEQLGPIAGMRRARRLARSSYWRVMGISLVGGGVVSTVGLLLQYPAELLAAELAGTRGWLLRATAGCLVGVVLTPVGAAVTVLLYFDQRVRREGLDLDIEVRAVFPPSIGAPTQPAAEAPRA